jgi:trans-L-3-hydroxyproline dehydratase
LPKGEVGRQSRQDILPNLDLTAALDWSPSDGRGRVVAIDSHTAGEPFRVVVEGVPPIPGTTMIERRRFAREHLDSLRRILMWEPRGHADMYGGFVGPPTDPTSDISVLFLHNEGFSTMCGHGIIALTTVVLDTGILPSRESETVIRIDTPAGQIEATAVLTGGTVESVRFRNVASFVVDLDNQVDVPGIGRVRYDLAFGGAFYAYVSAPEIGLRLVPEASNQLIETGRAIKQAVMDSRAIPHPTEPDLEFLYGIIFIGPAEDQANHSRNVCVFAEGEVDRSPTGTGVSGRLAIHHARGQVEVGETIIIESIVGSTFSGRVLETADFEGLAALIPEIGGKAHITGRSEFWLDPEDSLGSGFLLR